MKKSDESFFFYSDGIKVPVILKTHSNARRIIMRVSCNRDLSGTNLIFVTLPIGVHDDEARKFLEKNESWVVQQLTKLPPAIQFVDGAHVPYFGVPHKIVHKPSARRGVWKEQQMIFVSGNTEFINRRVIDWFKKEARVIFTSRVKSKTSMLKIGFGRISIRDTHSRWGSCSSNGNLSFSWRLLMAPDFVFDYVISHEVAHILEHNHGQKFWQLTTSLSSDMLAAKRWLKEFGDGLMAYY